MKKRVQLHARDVLCYQENEEYYLNRFPKEAKTEGMVYYFQKIDGVVVKTEISIKQRKDCTCLIAHFLIIYNRFR